MNFIKRKKRLIIYIIIFVIAAIAILTLGINAFVKHHCANKIITSDEAANLKDVDCILVLGCQVKSDGTPSAMLADRLKRSVELYDLHAAPKILMSGDHGSKDYNEVGAMKNYAISAGVSSDDIFLDHAGFSTYESIYRAREIFNVKKIVIVTQKYHLYRALYIADKLGIDAYGVSADYYRYSGQLNRELREILARCKDFVITLFLPSPSHLSNPISLKGSGEITDDTLQRTYLLFV